MLDSLNGAEGDRTPGLGIANAALSQLSYCPNCRRKILERVCGSVKRGRLSREWSGQAAGGCFDGLCQSFYVVAAALGHVGFASAATVELRTGFAHQRIHVARRIR